MVRKIDIALAVISGVLLVLSFAPFDLFPLAWIAIAILLVSIQGKNLITSFILGLLSGFVYFMGTVYWMSHSMYMYGNLPIIITLFLLILLCLYLSLYVGVFAMTFNFLSQKSKIPASLICPVLWVSLEFIRTYALTGFPWSILGYSQYNLLTLIQMADITGIYGISFFVAALNGMLFDIVQYRKNRIMQPLVDRWPLTLSTVFVAITLTMVVIYGTVRLGEDENNEKIRVSVIQGNIPQDQKWNISFQQDVTSKYETLTTAAYEDMPDMVVWPESALPFIFGANKKFTERLIRFQEQSDAHLLFGTIISKNKKNGESRISNSAVLLSPDGSVMSTYDKIHLVPFGEYVPLSGVFPFIKKMVAAIGDFVAGKEYVVMETPFAKIGNLICYEIIFPGLVREFAARGANVLVTITNDAWFGKTSAPYQHFSMAVFRAVENRMPVVRSANTGISGFIDSKGRILKESDIFVEATLTGEVSIGKNKSFYTKYGDIFAFICILISAVLIGNRFFSEKKIL